MRLPATKKERIQVFVLIGIGLIAVIYALVQLTVSPFLASKQKLRDELLTKKTALEKAERELKFAPTIKEEFNSVATQMDRIIADNVLRPILGSYLVGVTEFLEQQARATNIRLDEVQEIGIREPPRPKNTGSAAPIYFKSYSVQVSARGSFEQVTAFIMKLSKLNRYLCVSDIRITGQSDTPESHRLNMQIEWPIEAESTKQESSTGRGGGS